MTDSFSGNKYSAIINKELAIKLLNERCLVYSIYAMFFYSSLTVLFLNRILPSILNSEFNETVCGIYYIIINSVII